MITFIFILFSIFLLGLIYFLINNYFKNKNLELSPQEKMDKEAPYHQFASILILILVWDQVNYYYFEIDDSARNQLTINSFKV